MQRFSSFLSRGMSKGIAHLRDMPRRFPNPPPFIHVGGTNGKGSLCEYLFAGLKQNFKQVALFTSPHLVQVTERFRCSHGQIAEDHLLDLQSEVLSLSAGQELTFFEFTAFAFLLYCRDIAADIAIIEVGLGGRLDTTNLLEGKLATATTSISLDHTEILGSSTREILKDKLGIIRPGVPHYVPENLVHLDLAQSVCLAESVPLSIVSARPLGLRQPGLFQRDLASMALQILEDFHLPVSPLSVIESTTIPGRWQVLPERNVLLDCCHNPAGFDHLQMMLRENCTYKYLFFSLMKEKDFDHISSILTRVCEDLGILATYVMLDLDRANKFDGPESICPFPCLPVSEFRAKAPYIRDSIVCGSFHLLEEYITHGKNTDHSL